MGKSMKGSSISITTMGMVMELVIPMLRYNLVRCQEGMSPILNDCNDGNANVYTGAAEVCDGFDNDCDGSADENLQNVYYLDNDGDGLGNPNVNTSSCSQPSGFVSNTEDCNDSNPSATHIGSDPSCARTSCLAIHNENPNLGDGDYWIQPNLASAFQARLVT